MKRIRIIFFDILWDVIGATLFDIGIYCFAVNAEFAPIGFPGLTVILNYLFGFPLGLTLILLNIPAILISFKVLGTKFILRSAKTMIIFGLVLDYVVPYFPQYSGNHFYACICTGVFGGIGLTVVYLRGIASGGTDFIIMAIHKLLPHFSIGQITWVVDGSVILLGGFVFKNIDAVVIGLISVLITTIVVDKIMLGLNAGKLLFIITEKGELVANQISSLTGRGVTFVDGRGAYSKSEKQVIMCACKLNQVNFIRKSVEEIDAQCFLIVTDTKEVHGSNVSQSFGLAST